MSGWPSSNVEPLPWGPALTTALGAVLMAHGARAGVVGIKESSGGEDTDTLATTSMGASVGGAALLVAGPWWASRDRSPQNNTKSFLVVTAALVCCAVAALGVTYWIQVGEPAYGTVEDRAKAAAGGLALLGLGTAAAVIFMGR